MPTRCLTVFFVLLSLVLGAQVPDDDFPGIPGQSGWETDAYDVDSLVEVHNALKLDPLQIIRGEFSVFYERRISNRVSLEVGLGLTRRNWTYSWFFSDVDDLRRNIVVHTGPSMRLGLRYYLKDSEELEGVYLMPQFGRRVFKKTFRDLDDGGDLTGDEHSDRREYTEVNFTIGYQQLALSSNFMFDIYFGVGYVWRSGREVERIPDSVQGMYFSTPFSNSGVIPVLGVKLGWGF